MIVATFQKSEKIGLIKICKKYKKVQESYILSE